MTTVESKKKKIIYKGQLFEEYKCIPRQEKIDVINNIIATNRNIDVEIAKFKRLLRPKEVVEFMSYFGLE